MAESNLLKETVKTSKTVLKAHKRMDRYFPMQKVKMPVLMRDLEDVISK
jgi:hypothetical protein